MTWLMESPGSIVALGALTVAILIGGWLKTGSRAVIVAIAVAIIGFGALLYLERMVKTDREQLRETLQIVAEHAENNDVEAVMRHLYSGAEELRKNVRAEMPKYRFTAVRITGIGDIEIDDSLRPPDATVECFVKVEGVDKSGQIGEFRGIRRFVIVRFRKDTGDKWRVHSYKHLPVQEGFRRRD